MLLDKKVTVMCLAQVDNSPHVWGWRASKNIWANIKQKAQNTFFSKLGNGAKTTIFTVVFRDLNPGQMIKWKDRTYTITDVDISDPVLTTVTTAEVECTKCVVSRLPSGAGQLGYAGDPQTVCEFPGILVPKWAGYKQADPYAEIETTVVLVTPKSIKLRVNDIVTTAEGDKYEVHIVHSLDPHKSEYELYAREEA